MPASSISSARVTVYFPSRALLKMCFRTLSERFLVSLPVGPIGAITKQDFFCFSVPSAVMGQSLARGPRLWPADTPGAEHGDVGQHRVFCGAGALSSPRLRA